MFHLVQGDSHVELVLLRGAELEGLQRDSRARHHQHPSGKGCTHRSRERGCGCAPRQGGGHGTETPTGRQLPSGQRALRDKASRTFCIVGRLSMATGVVCNPVKC